VSTNADQAVNDAVSLPNLRARMIVLCVLSEDSPVHVRPLRRANGVFAGNASKVKPDSSSMLVSTDPEIFSFSCWTNSSNKSNDSVSSRQSWWERLTQITSVLAVMLVLLFLAWCVLREYDVTQRVAKKFRSIILPTCEESTVHHPSDKHRYLNSQTLGLKWRVVSWNRPKTGTELRNEALTAALHHKVHFSRKEFVGFSLNFAELSYSSYVKVGDKYYKPDRRAERCRIRRWVGGSWGIKEATADRKMTRSGLTYRINKDKPKGTKMPARMNSKSEVNDETTLFSITAYNQRVKRTCYRWSAPLCSAPPQKWTAGLTSLMLIAVVMFMAITSTGPTMLTGLTASPLTHFGSTTPDPSTLRDLWSNSNQVTTACNENCSAVKSIGTGALDCATGSCSNDDSCCIVSAVLPNAVTKQNQTALEDAPKSQKHDALRLHHALPVSHKKDALRESVLNRTPSNRKPVVRSGMALKQSAPTPVQKVRRIISPHKLSFLPPSLPPSLPSPRSLHFVCVFLLVPVI